MRMRLRGLARCIAFGAALIVIAGCSSGTTTHGPATAAGTTAVGTAPHGAPVVRTAAPATVSAAHTTTSVMGTATAAPPTGSVLQPALAAAALTSSDLPPGYAAVGPADTSTPLPGEVANDTTTYATTALPDLGLIVVGVLAFRDSAAAQAAFANVPATVQAANQATGLTVLPVRAPGQLGDDTQVFSATLTVQGHPLSGYAVVWRRGRLGGQILVTGEGAAAPSGPDAAFTLAQAQDARMQAVVTNRRQPNPPRARAQP
jgi:hypothetical protein